MPGNRQRLPHAIESATSAAAVGWSPQLRVTGWLILALVGAFAFWFFNYTDSNRSHTLELELQAIESPTGLSAMESMRAQLRSVPRTSRHRAGLGRPVVWLRVLIPAAPGSTVRTLHLTEKNVGLAEFMMFDETGTLVLRGRAGAHVDPENARRSFPGFAIEEPSYLAGKALELIVRYEPIGISSMRAELWRDDAFVAAQEKKQQRIILLIGALMFLSLYAVAAATAGRVTYFLVFGVWLLARCGFVVMESGYHYFAFGEAAGSLIGLQLRQLVYFAFPFATVMLVRTLFHHETRGTPAERFARRAHQLSGVMLACAFFLPFMVFQISLWIIALVTIAAIGWSLWYAMRQATDVTTWWFLAGVVIDVTGAVADLLYVMGIVQSTSPWLRAEQASLIAAVLTGMAVGMTLARERRRRLNTQADAIALLGRYEDVYRTVPIGLVSVGEDLRVERYNEGFARMFDLRDPVELDPTVADRAQTPALDASFPIELRQRISQELALHDECDFEHRLDNGQSTRWLRILARGKPGSYEASVSDVTEQREARERLAAAAQHDPLTGALNRLGLSNRIDEAIANDRDLGPAALCYVDLDRFKMLNDMFGHQAGDVVLIDVVARLRRALGDEAVISRLGGDEFVIMLAAADQSVQEGLAWKALAAITEHPYHLNDRSFSVTASIGVFRLIAGLPQAELIAGADRACQEAKRRGRNQVVMCMDPQALIQRRMKELSIVTRLHEEQTFAEFELFAQPIFALRKPAAYAGQIQLRHREDDGTLMSAEPLIRAAEQSGEMTRIDRWVLRRTLEWLSENAVAARQFDFISVHLSGTSLNDEFFKTFVIALLQKHASVADRVVVEMTEAVAMQDIFMMKRFVESVRSTGARLALNEFGSGYSNFSSIAEIPASFLKIDRGFVGALRGERSTAPIIRTMQTLAHELQMDCLADGIEDPETLEMLRSIGMDYGQGQMLGEAMPIETFAARAGVSSFTTDHPGGSPPGAGQSLDTHRPAFATDAD